MSRKQNEIFPEIARFVVIKQRLGCFIDTEGACDSTEFETITEAAIARKMDTAAIDWII